MKLKPHRECCSRDPIVSLPSVGFHLIHMASLFPTEQEARAFADARALREWAGLSQEVKRAFEGRPVPWRIGSVTWRS